MLADVWKKNTLEGLKAELLEYEIVGEFLADIRKDLGRGNEETVKVVKFKKVRARRKDNERVCTRV